MSAIQAVEGKDLCASYHLKIELLIEVVSENYVRNLEVVSENVAGRFEIRTKKYLHTKRHLSYVDGFSALAEIYYLKLCVGKRHRRIVVCRKRITVDGYYG